MEKDSNDCRNPNPRRFYSMGVELESSGPRFRVEKCIGESQEEEMACLSHRWSPQTDEYVVLIAWRPWPLTSEPPCQFTGSPSSS